MLSWFERMIRTLRESPEVGAGSCKVIDDGAFPPGVLAHRADDRTGTMLFLHNLADEPAQVDLSSIKAEADHPNQVFGDETYDDQLDLSQLALNGYGYRWLRINRSRTG
jgi:maltose alpha-D-glucosyltransferase/alpha-amylase